MSGEETSESKKSVDSKHENSKPTQQTMRVDQSQQPSPLATPDALTSRQKSALTTPDIVHFTESQVNTKNNNAESPRKLKE